MLRAEGPPLTPSGSQARELLRQELAKPEYQERKGPVQRLVEWISDTLNDFFSTQGGTLPSIAWLVGLLLVLLVAVLAATYLRVGHVQAGVTGQQDVLGEKPMSAEELRRRAAEHELAGRFGAGTVDYFRALAVRSFERVLVDVTPGLTAHDIAESLGGRFPDAREDLLAAAATFDAVLYGGRSADEQDCSRIRNLDHQLARTRPPLAVSNSARGDFT